MSIRQSMLVLLADRPMYGAELRAEFETRTGGTWPLNVGQVYTTLARLERDGLVEAAGTPDDEGRITYRLTAAGSIEADQWWQHPVQRENAPRSELAIKLALAVTVAGLDVAAVVQVQRAATLSYLQDLTRLKRHRSEGEVDLAWSLVLENLIFGAEAEVRWLDHVESMLSQHGANRLPSRHPADSAPLTHDLQEQPR